VAGVAAWWLLASPGTGPASMQDAVELAVRTDPPGATVAAEGFPLGRAPLTLRGASGSKVRVRAGEGPRAVTEDVVLGKTTAVRLVLGTTPSAAAARTAPPDAGPDLSPPADPAQAKQRGQDGAGRPPRPDARRERPDARTRRKPRTPAAPPVARRRRGKLNVFVSPWARVKVDGKAVGVTPVTGLQLRSGAHRVELHNPELGRRERVNVEVRPGPEPATIRRRWDP